MKRKDAMARLDAAVNQMAWYRVGHGPWMASPKRWRAYRRALRALLKERADAAADAARTLTGQLRSWEPVRRAVRDRR